MQNIIDLLPYRNIKNLFSNELYPWEYDFKNENDNEEYKNNVKDLDNQLVKFAYYRKDDNFDTDGTKTNKTCNLTREIYRDLFGFKDKEKKSCGYTGKCNEKCPYDQINRYGKSDINCDEFGPETMNTSMEVLSHFCFEKFKLKLNKFPKCPFNTPTQKFSKKFLIHTVLEHKFAIEVDKDIKEIIFAYLSSITNMGNYCLVPAYLNPARGSQLIVESEGKSNYIVMKDYFDKTLFCMSIKKDKSEWYWYDRNKKVKNKIKWKAENFSKYININFLWDYCNFNNENQIYDVKNLFAESEDFKKGVFILSNENVDCEKDFNNFMKNVIWCIKRRGFLMTLLLLLKQNNEEQYNKIKIHNSEVYTMNDAINMVLSIYGLEKSNELLMIFEDKTIHEVYNEFKQKLCNKQHCKM